MLFLGSLGFTSKGDPRTWLKVQNLTNITQKGLKLHMSTAILQVKTKRTQTHVHMRTKKLAKTLIFYFEWLAHLLIT